jgi:hypothetical protein
MIIFSLLLSLLLFLGSAVVGYFILNTSNLKKSFINISSLEFQYPIIGLVFLLIISYPVVLFSSAAFPFIKISAYFLIFLSFFFIKFFFSIKNILLFVKRIKNCNNFYLFILLLVIFGYFLLSLSPPTNADSLDYHLGIAKNILKTSKFSFSEEWFTAYQAGPGEVLISIGLVIGAEQFSSLIQFSSILSIFGVFFKLIKINDNQKNKLLTILIIFSSPIFIMLVPSAKPQLFFSALILICFSLSIINLANKNHNNNYYDIAIISLLGFVSCIGKFSFNLSFFLILIICFLFLLRKKIFFFSILIIISIFFLIFIPHIIWKYNEYGGTFFSYFLYPFPIHKPGLLNFFAHNKAIQDHYRYFPFFLFPIYGVNITEFIGFGWVLFLYFFKNYKKYRVRILILLIISYLFISNIYARPPARFYLDPLLWVSFIFLKENIIIKNKFLKIIFILQISAAMIVIWTSIYNLLPGSFSQQNRHKVLSDFADGYLLVKWSNSILPKNTSVIINHRSSYFIDNEFISLTFLPFVNSVELKYYSNYILNKNPQFFLTYGFNDEPQLGPFKNCLGDLLYKSKKVGKIATRNFLKNSEYYDGYIYRVEYHKLENCLK